MKSAGKYLHMLHRPIGLSAVAALAAVALWSAADRELARARAEHAAVLAKHTALSERITRAAEAERAMTDHLAAYLDLVARGIIGEERRREWIDAMTRFKVARGLYEVKYALEPRRVLAMPAPAVDDLELRASRMELDLRLLHEGDLLDFLGDLHNMPGAQLLPRACAIRRLESSSADRGTERRPGPRLHAHCSFDLATIAERRAGREH